jgi:protein subunit release factor A
VEKLINDFEIKEKELESELADPATYNDPGNARELNQKFIEVKGDLSDSMKKWESLSKQLAEIEQQFG